MNIKLLKKLPKKNEVNRQRRANVPDQKRSTYSYYRSSQSNQNNANKAAKKDAITINDIKKLLSRGGVMIALLGVVAFTILITTINNDPKINIETNTIQLRSNEEYLAKTKEVLQSSILNRSKFTIDSESLSKELKNSFPEIENVRTSMPLFQRHVIVGIEIREPTFVLKSDEGVSIIDQNGVVLDDQHTNDTSPLSLISIKDTSGLRPEPGKPVFPSQTGIFLAKVKEQLDKGNVSIRGVTLSSNPFDIQVDLEDTNYEAKFNVLEDPIEQSGALLAFLNERESRGLEEPKKYIDVRVSERLYYQ